MGAPRTGCYANLRIKEGVDLGLGDGEKCEPIVGCLTPPPSRFARHLPLAGEESWGWRALA